MIDKVSSDGNVIAAWWYNIHSYFTFMNNRRRDLRFSVLSSLRMSVLVAGVIAFVACFLVLFADPSFISYALSPDFQKPYYWDLITKIGASNWILLSTGIVLIGLSFATADRFKGAKQLVWHRVFLNCWYLFTTVALSGILVLLLKLVFARARPMGALLNDVWVTGHFQDAYLYGSFPSGHATTAGAMAIGFALLFPRWKWFFVLIGILVAISRPALGVHFPSDVWTGFCIGGLFSYFWARSFAQKRLLFGFTDNGKLRLRGEG